MGIQFVWLLAQIKDLHKKNMSNLTTPMAYIAVNNGRTKIHQNNKVYLSNKQEFQIELYNPSTKTVMASISFNGIKDSSGLVLKPGQRYFLDRFIEDKKKLLFDTYEVEDGNSEVKAAIAKNGIVTVDFYNEKHKVQKIQYYNNNILRGIDNQSGNNDLWNQVYGGLSTSNSFVGTTISNNFNSSASSYTTTGLGLTSLTSNVTMDGLSDNLSFTSSAYNSSLTPISKGLVETGRVEKGNESNQTFGISTQEFEIWKVSSVTYNLLPESTKPVEVAELVNKFCHGCGNKVQTSWRFCVQCSTKLKE